MKNAGDDWRDPSAAHLSLHPAVAESGSQPARMDYYQEDTDG